MLLLLLEKGVAGEVDPIVVVAKVIFGAPSFILAKRKQDDSVGLSGRKNLKAPMSHHALRQAVGLIFSAGDREINIIMNLWPTAPRQQRQI